MANYRREKEGEMDKEDLEDIKDLRKDVQEKLNLLDEAIASKNLKWMHKDILEMIAKLGIMGKKADIGKPHFVFEQADKMISGWYNLKHKLRYVQTKELYSNWVKDYDTMANLAIILEEKITKKWINFKGKDILDLGCGTGRYAVPLAKKNNVVAIDFTPAMLNQARKKAKTNKVKIDFEIADITKYHTKKQFDVIISMLVHDHIKDLKPLAEVIEKASKIGTELIISNIHPMHTYKTQAQSGTAKLIEGFVTDQYYHPLHEYLSLLRHIGFELVDYQDAMCSKNDVKSEEMKKFEWLAFQPVVALYRFKRVK